MKKVRWTFFRPNARPTDGRAGDGIISYASPRMAIEDFLTGSARLRPWNVFPGQPSMAGRSPAESDN